MQGVRLTVGKNSNNKSTCSKMTLSAVFGFGQLLLSSDIIWISLQLLEIEFLELHSGN